MERTPCLKPLGTGVAWAAQVLPFHDAAKGFETPAIVANPTASHAAAEAHETLVSELFVEVPAPKGRSAAAGDVEIATPPKADAQLRAKTTDALRRLIDGSCSCLAARLRPSR